MRFKKPEAWRDEVSTEPFQCACGCALKLSKGDLHDAVMVMTRLGATPRTCGVDISRRTSPRTVHVEPPEPMVSRPCSKCGDIVAIPEYAANLLDERKCFWPLCGDCRKPKEQTTSRPAREYWE